MTFTNRTLVELGWKAFFSDQLSAEEQGRCQPVRVMAVHRGMVVVEGEGLSEAISSINPDPAGPEDRPTVGDWLLVDRETQALVRILERTSLFKRPAPGDDRRVQLIAANLDTLFIVTSCNEDFNVARLERYLVLAREFGVQPVLVLTKADLAEDAGAFLEAARSLQPGLEVEMVDGRDPASAGHLVARCRGGETVALVGSSGVGKSTLINTLRGCDSIATQPIREADGKGRHTTTVREMHRLGTDLTGGWLIDTPGMRELQVLDAGSGLAEVFDDIAELTLTCRFTNCTHEDGPECAVQAAIAGGALEQDRFERWRKLTDEDALGTASMVGRRTRPAKSRKRTVRG